VAFAPMGFDAVYRLTPCRMDLLAAGALLALIDHRDAAWFSRNLTGFLAGAGTAVAVFATMSVGIPTFRTSGDHMLFNVVGFGLSTVFFTCTLAYVRGARRGPALSTLRHPAVRYIGRISYMAYLVHMLCLDLAARVVHGRGPVAALGLALTIAGASASWYALEAPLLRLRHAVTATARRAARAAT
jgi:peptidoglycan/LPS O-acetylase OafA/YrhL